jgi:hypothetical protein
MAAATNWAQQTNPATGLPYASEQEFTAAQSGMQTLGTGTATPSAATDSSTFASDHNTDYNFGQSGLWTTQGKGYDFFGSSSGGDSKTWVIQDKSTGQWRPATQAEKTNGQGYVDNGWLNSQGMYEVPTNGGYIDPNTGKITYNNAGSSYDDPTKATTKDYYYDQDYGLGPTAKGIIPLQRDASGTPTKFYAGVGGGGGQVFDNLADAQTAVASYKAWYDQQHPAGTAGTQIAPTGPAPIVVNDPVKAGDLTTPGAGENYYDSTKDFYTQPTNGQNYYDSTKDFYTGKTNAQSVFDATPNQPTQSQQLWNTYSGMYQNPNYLDDYYKTEEQKAQTTLDRKAASGGWGGGGAAARATAGIGLNFANQALLAREGFTQAGMGLAGEADTANTAQTNLRGTLASNADTQNRGQITSGQTAAGAADTANLVQITGGQAAANSAETLDINRENGGLTAATTLAQDQSSLVAAGLSPATASSYATQLATLQAQWQQAGLTAQQQYQKAQDLASSMGIVLSSALNYWLSTKLGASVPGTTTATTGSLNPYSSPFENA